MPNPPKILIFDSGVGGFSVVNEIRNCALDVEINYLADTSFFPYGSRSDLELLSHIPPLVQAAAKAVDAAAVIIACNTASTLALWQIRELVKIPVIGVVPAIKPAALISKSKTIGLLATPRTVGAAYTNELIENHNNGCKVLRFAPENLAKAAEDFMLGNGLDNAAINAAITGLYCQDGGENIDTIVLACTHYPLVLEALKHAAKRDINWVDSGAAIARRLGEVLGLKINGGETLMNIAYSTGGMDRNFMIAATLLGFSNTSML